MKLARFLDTSTHRDLARCAGVKNGRPCRATVNPHRSRDTLCPACRGRRSLDMVRDVVRDRDRIVARLRKRLDPGPLCDDDGRPIRRGNG